MSTVTRRYLDSVVKETDSDYVKVEDPNKQKITVDEAAQNFLANLLKVRNVAVDAFDDFAEKIDGTISELFLNGKVPNNVAIQKRQGKVDSFRLEPPSPEGSSSSPSPSQIQKNSLAKVAKESLSSSSATMEESACSTSTHEIPKIVSEDADEDDFVLVDE